MNEIKTEKIIFHRTKNIKSSIKIGTQEIVTKEEMKALGLIFQQNLRWGLQLKKKINSCKSSLWGLNSIRKYFEKKEFTQLVMSFFYGKLYYAGEVWMNCTLSAQDWRRLESLHRTALRLIEGDWEKKLSYEELKKLSKRANPYQWRKYLEAKLLFTIVTMQEPEEIFTDIMCQSYTETRKPHRLRIFDEKKNKAGNHILANRLAYISRQMEFDRFGIDINTHKFRMNSKACFFAD